MCGIAGIAAAGGGASTDDLVRMRDVLAHRGPDDAGVWVAPDTCAGLAHRRLSIIDLSVAGHQPMHHESGHAEIVFNGEIYNFRELRYELAGRGHRFSTGTDTEVVLAAYREWGERCVERLTGMFAFSVYDASRRILFIARDRAGEKPLFYRHAAGRFAFASELKALMQLPRAPRALDLVALDYYLAFGYVPGELCILEGYRKLPAAHTATYHLDTDSLRVSRYWSLPDAPSADEADAEELVDRLDALLEDSVRRQLVADVPVGILLSGGIDSSLVTAVAARVSDRPVRTFTVSFPGHGKFDEAAHARLIASHFGTEHTEFRAEPPSVDLLPALARQYDEPMADSSMIPTYLVSRLIRRDAAVALGGDGGDELFGGYGPYSWMLRQHRMRSIVPRPLRRAAAAAAMHAIPPGIQGRNYVMGFGSDIAETATYSRVLMDRRLRRQLLAPVGGRISRRLPDPEQYNRALVNPSDSPIRTLTALDFLSYLPDDILVKVDRASMLTSLEVRAPWLDHRIIEFAFGTVPDQLRATASERKILPRRLARRLLPPGTDLERKQGFSIPFAEWFRGEWGRLIEAVLNEASRDLFDSRTVRALMEGQRRGRSNSNRLFALTLFELWRREYGVTLG